MSAEKAPLADSSVCSPVEVVSEAISDSADSITSIDSSDSSCQPVDPSWAPPATIDHRTEFVTVWNDLESKVDSVVFPVEIHTSRSPATWLKKIAAEPHKWPTLVLKYTRFVNGRIILVGMTSPEHAGAASSLHRAITDHDASLPAGSKCLPGQNQKLSWLQRPDGSNPGPDLIVKPRGTNQQAPSFAAEVGFSEPRQCFEDDAALLLANGVDCVLLLYIPSSQKKVRPPGGHQTVPRNTVLKYDMEYRLQRWQAGAIVDSGWIHFGNRAIGLRRRIPCRQLGQVVLQIPTSCFFQGAPAAPAFLAPPPAAPQHWTQLPANITIDMFQVQQDVIEYVKSESGYV